MDGEGKTDVTFREIYYYPSWADDGITNIDVESIALHEAGHGLSQGRFGTIAIKKNGTIRVSPKAVMNAIYLGPSRKLLGTDKGGRCSIGAQWPN